MAPEGDMMGNNKSSGSSTSRHLVAPELLAGLSLLPAFDFNAEVLRLARSGGPITGSIERPALTPEQQAVTCEQRFIPGPAGAPDVRVLVYTPATATGPRPVLLHMHGGGYVLGTPEINDEANRALVAEVGCVVVSVDYRLAPDTRYPGAVEDCYAALRWLYANADALGMDRNRVGICGESAGGGHAATLGLLVKKRGEFNLCLQMLDCPMLDDRTGAADPHPYCGEFVWTRNSNRFGWQALLGVEPGSADVPVEAVPARATDVGGLPPTFIAVGALDLFLEESLEYARRLVRAGVPTELHVIPGAYHGFQVSGLDTPQAVEHLRLRHAAVARAFRQ
jgi:acetyl esterase/lipase